MMVRRKQETVMSQKSRGVPSTKPTTAEKERKMRMKKYPLGPASRRAWMTLMKAVSVEE